MGGWAQKGFVQAGWVQEGLSPLVEHDVCIDLIFRDGVEEHDLVVRTDPVDIDLTFEKFPEK